MSLGRGDAIEIDRDTRADCEATHEPRREVTEVFPYSAGSGFSRDGGLSSIDFAPPAGASARLRSHVRVAAPGMGLLGLPALDWFA